jgi:hypothetical protein
VPFSLTAKDGGNAGFAGAKTGLLRAVLGRISDIYWLFRQTAPAGVHARMEPRSASCLSLSAKLA